MERDGLNQAEPRGWRFGVTAWVIDRNGKECVVLTSIESCDGGDCSDPQGDRGVVGGQIRGTGR